MAERTRKPPHNRDLEQPRRTGETIQPTIPPEPGQSERERNTPLPEEETYERETPNGAPPRSELRRSGLNALRAGEAHIGKL